MDNQTQTLPACGIHHGVAFHAYRAWDAVNISLLKEMARTPAHCKAAMTFQKQSDALDVGAAVHCALLEPARFEQEYYLGTAFYNAATKEGKEARAKEEAEAAGRIYIRNATQGGATLGADDVRAMVKAVRENKAAARLLDAAGHCELSMLWKDNSTGLHCKGRIDKLCSTAGVILEVKTCRDASGFGFARQVAQLGYNAQASFYRVGVERSTGDKLSHVFLAIESKPPYASKLWTLDDAALAAGKRLWRQWLDDYAACLKANIWPGYSETVDVLTLPDWANDLGKMDNEPTDW